MTKVSKLFIHHWNQRIGHFTALEPVWYK